MTARPIFSLTDPLPTGRVAMEASAGTGKTYTLAGLVVRYVAEAGIPIDEILIVTFTRAAAAELRHRVRSRLTDAVAALRSPLDQPLDDELFAFLAVEDRQGRLHRLEQAVAGFDAATITTIHGFAQRMLSALGSAAPGDHDATLVDDTNELVAAVCADVLATASFSEPTTADQLPKLDALKRSVIKILGNPGIAVIPSPDEADSTPTAARHRRLVDRVLAEVHRRRRAEGTLSFDDVLTQLRDGLQAHPDTADGLRRRFGVALIDEFQDTDPVQWELFSALFGSSGDATTLVLVADPKQAIYAFRGANVHTYLKAAYESGTTRSTLGTNWRSDGALLDALGQLLGGATFGDARIGFVPVAAAPGHEHRRLTAGTDIPLPALQVRAVVGAHLKRTPQGQIVTEEAEAAGAADLAEQVQRLLETAILPGAEAASPEGRVRPGDIAVLIGKHGEAPVIQAALRRRNIPAVVARGGSVLESAAATHWRWLLTALTRPADPARARTAALSWFFGWSVARIDAADETELADVQEQLFRWAEILETHGTIDFCAHVRSDSGIVARVLACPDGDRDLTDLDHIAGLLQTNSDSHRPTAVGLLTTLEQLGSLQDMIDPDNDVTARHVESEAEAVQIMTIYVAKGLEFPIVCVPTLWRNSYATASDVVYQDPISDKRTFDVAKSENWPTKKDADERKKLANDEVLGENLRLLYVALTRAQHQTLVWWTRAKGSEITGLARVLFGRSNGTIDPGLFSAPKMTLPDDDDLYSELDVAFAPAGDTISVSVPGPAEAPVMGWTDDAPPRPRGALELAVLQRTPVRTNRRWSFTAISGRAHADELDPEDQSLGDAGAADEPGEAPEREEAGTDLPLGAVPGGPQFGTLVHEVLEQTDFAAEDLEAELRSHVSNALRWNAWPIDVATLVTGLRAAIDTPLGPLLSWKRLRDFTRRDYLRELDFELRLGESAHAATDRDIGALVLNHLPADDPLRPWAENLATGLFGVELAGHLTGSIDLVLRVVDPSAPNSPPRFVVADYKTNKLPGFGRESRSSDYHPDRLPAAMIEHHYPLQALLYTVALHRYLRWRLPGYQPTDHLGGVAYLFVRGMVGADTPTDGGSPYGVFGWRVPPALVCALSDLLDGRIVLP
jgi:exodeoxyribonuclease V beta subunit